MPILILDDNVEITDMLSKYLTTKGFDCKVVNDSTDGLNIIKNEKFNLIFLDIAMPSLSGIDIIETLEKDGILKDQNITVCTASTMPNQQIRDFLKKDGISHFLKKPIRLKEVLEIVQSEIPQ